jgi:hypothetical protein
LEAKSEKYTGLGRYASGHEIWAKTPAPRRFTNLPVGAILRGCGRVT